MNRHRSRIAAALVVAVALGGCSGVGQRQQWAVGTCVQVTEGGGTTAVACALPHTHKVIAIAARAEACPSETDMFAQPADPDDGSLTTCFQAVKGSR